MCYRIYIVRSGDMRGMSMLPTVRPGEWLLVRGRDSSPLKRGDIIVHAAEQGGNDEFVKRVVGLPGEEVRLREGSLYIDGKPLREPYLGGLPSSLGLDDQAWSVDDGAIFVMGDNRAHSRDSRAHGEIGLDSVLGRVVSRLWPPARWGGLGSG